MLIQIAELDRGVVSLTQTRVWEELGGPPIFPAKAMSHCSFANAAERVAL